MADSMPFREFIVKSGVSELFFEGECDSDRAICWTRLSSDGETWILAVSNGSEIWRAIFEKEDMDTQCTRSGLENIDEFLEVIKDCFEEKTVSMAKVGSKIIFECRGTKTTIKFDLYESKINDRKIELRYILFHLTDKMGDLRKSLAEVNEVLEGERRQEKNQAASGLENRSFGFEPARKAGQGSNLRRKQGHSLVNPNSKKAKKAKGISFE